MTSAGEYRRVPRRPCTFTIMSTKTLYRYHYVHEDPVPLPLCPRRPCTVTVMSTKTLYRYHYVHDGSVPLPLCPRSPCTITIMSTKEPTWNSGIGPGHRSVHVGLVLCTWQGSIRVGLHPSACFFVKRKNC